MNKNSNFESGAAILTALFIGIVFGASISFFATAYKFERDLQILFEPMSIMRAKCEAELPRSQKCVVKFMPQDK